jgi:hypothetical protein
MMAFTDSLILGECEAIGSQGVAHLSSVVPAEAGTQYFSRLPWAPAAAGATD